MGFVAPQPALGITAQNCQRPGKRASRKLADAEMYNGGCTWRETNLMDIPVGLMHLPPLCRAGRLRADRIGAGCLPGNVLQPCTARANRRLWADYPLELFRFLMANLEDCAGVGGRLYGRAKAPHQTPRSARSKWWRLSTRLVTATRRAESGDRSGRGGGAGAMRALVPGKIAFTGSTEVGRGIMQQAASTIKKVTLELGGKSPSILLDDADLDLAIDGSLWATFMHNGQACESGTRLLVRTRST